MREAIGSLASRPRSRSAIRESLDRLWALGLFAEVWVDEAIQGDGVRLDFHLLRRPFVQSLVWTGEAGLSDAEAADAAGLELGGDAVPSRLDEARQRLLEWYRTQGFFAADVRFEVSADSDTNGRDITMILRAGEQARVGSVRIQGGDGIPTTELAKSFGMTRGDRYTEAAAKKGLQAVEERLQEADYFESRVTMKPVEWDRQTNRTSLELEVAAGPKFRVEFSGNRHLAASALRKRLTFSSLGIVDEGEIRTSARTLEAAYQEEGYHFVQVTGSLRREGEAGVIRFQITEGPRVKVESVAVRGNRAFPAGRLQALIGTQPSGLIGSGYFRQDVLEQDMQLLVAFYRSQGFSRAAAGPPEVQFTSRDTRARVVIPIAEGPRLVVGNIRIQSGTRIPAEALRIALALTPGSPWDPAKAEQGRREVEHRYATQGYLAAGVALETSRRDGRVDVLLRVQEGPQTRIGRILISGLVLTQEPIVRRELPFGPGDPFDPAKLLEAERRLSSLGIFDRVRVGPLQPPPAPFADVDITVLEGKPWRAQFGLGYSTEEGARGSAQVGHNNLFGTDRSLRLEEKVSQMLEQTSLTYVEPRLLGTDWKGEATASRERQKEIGYRLEQAGETLGIRRDLFPESISGLSTALRYRLDQVRRFDVDTSLAAADVVAGSQLVASLTPSLVLDRRDSPINPTRGSLNLLSLEGGGNPLGSEVNFLKSVMETHWFLDPLPPTVLALSGRLGLATPLGNTPDLAVEDRFLAGGSTTIRGYRLNRVGPHDSSGNPTGGDALVLLNAEWRFPIWRFLGGALFVDSGAVTPSVGDLGQAAFKTGVGAGLRLATPVGPVRFDAGYGLNRIPGEDQWQLYFSVGYPF